MKLIALVMTIALSTAASASIPATEAFKNILPAGTYAGYENGSKKCSVTVDAKEDFVSVMITTSDTTEGFGLLNKALGTSVNETTGEISATQSLNAPFYLRGGTKFLNVQANDLDQVQVSISKILLDHRGNDASTYLECTVSL